MPRLQLFHLKPQEHMHLCVSIYPLHYILSVANNKSLNSPKRNHLLNDMDIDEF